MELVEKEPVNILHSHNSEVTVDPQVEC